MRAFVVGSLTLCLLVASQTSHAAFCKFHADRAGGLDLTGVERVFISARAGELEIRGSQSARRIEARGAACASSQELLDQIQLQVEVRNGTAHVTAITPQPAAGGLLNISYAYLELGVALPAHLPVEVIDSSGDARLTGLASLKIQDSSGDLIIKEIAGLVEVEDSSGDIELAQAGAARIDDSSGDIDIESIAHDVDIDDDSSGEISIDEVRGNVLIHNDSSGDIRVTEVTGNVKVESDSSGGIDVQDVGGDFVVERDGSGSIRHDGVKGRVELP